MGIKFNLVFNDIKIRNLEQLKENFYIEDVLLSYKNKKLMQWLEDRNLSNEAQKIQEIDSNLSEFGIIKIIMAVLEIEFSKIKIIKNSKDTEALTEDNSEILEYQEKIKNLENELEIIKIQMQIKSKDIFVPVFKSLLTNKIDSYIDLKEKIKANYKELRTIRNIIEKIEINYSDDFNKDSNFVEEFRDLPLVIFAVLMNKNLNTPALKDRLKGINYFYLNYGSQIIINNRLYEKNYTYIEKYITKININNRIRQKFEGSMLFLGLNSKLYFLDHYYNIQRYDIINDFEIDPINETNNNDIYVYYIKID